MNLKFPPSTTTWKPPLEIMKEEASVNVWKESFLVEIPFLTRNDDLRKMAGNWATYCIHVYYVAELVQGEKEHSDWFPERSELRWTAHELNSLICVLEKKFKRKHCDVKYKPFFVVWPKILTEVLRKWRNKNKFSRLIVARALSSIKCAVPSGNRAITIKTFAAR